VATDIQRPSFYEGQILGAADLQRSLDYAREQQARHARCTHTWGIACGLALSKKGKDEVQVGPGVAIDSSGAEIVVPAAYTLNPAQFELDVGPKAKEHGSFFSVFIARTNQSTNDNQLLGQCGTSGKTRIAESYAILFKRSAVDWNVEPADPGVAAGPDDSPQSQRLILLGFVRWNETSRKFDDFRQEHEKFRPQHIGIRADQVIGSNGRLHLRSQQATTTDAPMVVLDGDNEEEMFVLGVDKGDGTARPLFSVDAKGNVTAQGAFRGQVAVGVGQILVQTGVATDGVTLPLPRGLTEANVKDKNVAIHTSVIPRIDWSQQPTDEWGPFVLECSIDDKRRAKCLIRWMRLGGSSTGPMYVDIAGAVDYTVIASVPPKGGVQ